MGRPRRTDPAGGLHHVVNRGAARQDIFRSDHDRIEFERLVGVAHERFGVRVHAYCLMSNHYHLLIECPDGGLSEAMHMIASVYVRHHNERVGRDGPLFRNRFYAKAVTSDAYVRRLVRYIHRNPVAITGEDGVAGYRWSSLRSYVGSRRAPRWLHTYLVLEMFGGPEGLLRSVSTSIDLPPVTSSIDVLAAIDLVLDEHAIGDAPRLGRTISTLLLDRGLDLTAATGGPSDRSPAALAQARRRARRRAAAQPDLLSVVEDVLRLVA